jgi:uncharacterized membrane protein YgcG
MSPSDVPPDEMGLDPNATDDALERMLSGQAPTTDEWPELARFVEDLREAVPARPLASEDLHVAAMVETSHLIADNGDPVVRPVSNADAPAPQVSRLPKLRRKPMKRSTRTLVRVLAPIAAVLTVMGSMAVAGALPHTVQKAVSHTAGIVGLNLPGDDESTDVPGQDDQGENADDQGDNNNQGDSSTKDTAVTTNDQGDQGESSDTQTSADDQGENDDSQGDNNNQGEDTQSGDTSGGDSQSGDTQSGDTSGGGDSQSGDSQSGSGDTQSGDTSGGGDSQGGD